MNKNKILLLCLIFMFSCQTPNMYLFYEEETLPSQATNLLFHLQYKEKFIKSVKKKDNEVVIQFNGQAFKDSKVIMNKDTISFDYNSKCHTYPAQYRKVCKEDKKIKVKYFNKILKVKLNNKYDFINISYNNNRWIVVFSDFPFVYIYL